MNDDQFSVHIIGFGGMGHAVAQAIHQAGFNTTVYLLENSASFSKCEKLQLNALPMGDLKNKICDHDLVLFACPDRKIGEVYSQFIAPLQKTIHCVLLHGFAAWSKSIHIQNTHHTLNLLAPKSIGVELLAAILSARTSECAYHSLKAAFFISPHAESVKAHDHLRTLALEGLNFAPENLIAANFDQETVGYLISEQLLLCGGVFSLLEWTMNEMKLAGIPEALIQEECITELLLIANVLKKRGLAETVKVISDSAKAGAVMMRERFIENKLPELLHLQAQEVINKKFLQKLEQEPVWREKLNSAFQERPSS